MSAGLGSAARKAELRRQLRAKALALPPEYCRRADEAIARKLFCLPAFQEARTLFCFVGSRGEIDTRPILQRALDMGKQLCVPLCTGPGQMEARALPDLNALAPGRYGILEPQEGRCPLVQPGQIDLVLAPCLSATRQGVRLGHGGGYYDRYLAGWDGTALLLCREALLSPDLPAEPWDIPFGWLLTEEGLWRRGRKEEICSETH